MTLENTKNLPILQWCDTIHRLYILHRWCIEQTLLSKVTSLSDMTTLKCCTFPYVSDLSCDHTFCGCLQDELELHVCRGLSSKCSEEPSSLSNENKISLTWVLCQSVKLLHNLNKIWDPVPGSFFIKQKKTTDTTYRYFFGTLMVY